MVLIYKMIDNLKTTERQMSGRRNMEGRTLIAYLAIKYEGDWNKIFEAIKNRELVDDKAVDKAIKSCKSKFITILDAEYPDSLKRMHQPPFVLFYKGDIKLLNNEKILGVSGCKEPSRYGEDRTVHILKEFIKLNPKAVIASSPSRGIATVAIQTAVHDDTKVIAVLPSGLDKVYPSNAKALVDSVVNAGGLAISEYPDGVRSKQDHLPMRERALSGVSRGLFVPECALNSGTNMTVMFTLQSGRDVYALPCNIDHANNSCNKLIQDGAFLVTSGDDLSYYFK